MAPHALIKHARETLIMVVEWNAVCELHTDHVKAYTHQQKGGRICSFSTDGDSRTIQGSTEPPASWVFSCPPVKTWKFGSSPIYQSLNLFLHVSWAENEEDF